MRILKSMKLMKPAVFGMSVVCIGAVVATAQQSSQVLGKTNLQGWIDEAPGLPNSVEDASARRNAGSFYQPFYDKVDAFKKSFKQSIASREKPDEGTMRKAAEAQATSNLAKLNSLPAIQQMGGIGKLKQMTPEQRAKLAQQMVQTMQQNAVPLDSRTPGARQTSTSDAAITAGIQRDLQSMIQQRSAVESAFRTRDAEITNYKGSHREINEDGVAKIAAIPMVNDSVMGRIHDPEMQAAVNTQIAARHHERANWELQQRKALIDEQKTRLKDLASAYQNWLKANQDKINASTAPADLLRGANTEITVAEYELSFMTRLMTWRSIPKR